MGAQDSQMKDDYQSAVGRRRAVTDHLVPRQAEMLAATLDLEQAPGLAAGELLPGWHWIYFLDAPASGLVGADGRSVPGGFLPDTGLPRRMWGGGELIFHRPLKLGDQATSEACLESVEEKHGRSGRFVVLKVHYALADGDGLAVEERRDIVMREAASHAEIPARREPPGAAVWQRDLTPSHMLLFRFSALTFNSHRIHYDADYVRDVEGYPDLLVHGPLLALLLLGHLADSCPGVTIRRFRYRAVAPLFVERPLTLCGRPTGEGEAELWVAGEDGGLAMQADATFD